MQQRIVKPKRLASVAGGATLLGEARWRDNRAVIAGTFSTVGCPNVGGGAA